MIKVDKKGIPKIVQYVKFSYENYTFKITFFTGRKKCIDADKLIRYSPDLTDFYISNEQLQDAYIAAEKRGLELLYD